MKYSSNLYIWCNKKCSQFQTFFAQATLFACILHYLYQWKYSFGCLHCIDKFVCDKEKPNATEFALRKDKFVLTRANVSRFAFHIVTICCCKYCYTLVQTNTRSIFNPNIQICTSFSSWTLSCTGRFSNRTQTTTNDASKKMCSKPKKFMKWIKKNNFL